ncbi:H-NS family nucleoid-associated regulatory protein [Massilia sp. TN1-12]|uniref:H-NS histone family protein n=1 Tax=Massilia paldalensis TaxID=3377675 RepID=UPI00384A5B24
MLNKALSGYNLSELKGLQHDVEKAIKGRQQQDLQTARDQILAIARDAGISVDELLASSGKKADKGSGQKVKPQYENPADSSQTWSGRGRQPKWVAEALAGGKKLDQFRMK